MKPPFAWSLVVPAMFLSGCATLLAGAPTPALTPVVATAPGSPAITTAPRTPTPGLHATFSDVTLIPGRLPGDWSVIGLVVNPSSTSVSGLELEVGLLDVGGRLLGRQVVSPSLKTIGAGGSSPFAAHFSGAGAASGSRAEVISYRPADPSPVQVRIDQLESDATGDGKTVVYGRVTNANQQRVLIEDLAVLAVSPSGGAVALSQSTLGLSVLDPGGVAPFAAVLATDDPTIVLHGYASAQPISEVGQASLSFPDQAHIEVDDDGSPLVLGAVRNDSGVWTTADVVVSLQQGEELLGIAELQFPWPLAPGESLPFLADEFPGLHQRLRGEAIETESLRVEAQIDPAGSRVAGSATIWLEATVHAQEVIRGRLFLRGALTNGTSERVSNPAVYAVLRATNGELLSAGSATAGTSLEPGASLPFLVTLHLPRDVDVSMAEFDLRAGGSVSE